MKLTEAERKQRFGVYVKHPIGLINYRALELSVKGIEAEIKDEMLQHRRIKLFKIKKSINKILQEL